MTLTNYNPYLLAAAALTFIASLLHVATIIGGGDWYRFMGAGEQMALMSEAGDWYPAMVTAAIAGVLAVWGCYALAGANGSIPLPLVKPILIGITLVFIVRGSLGLVIPFVSDDPYIKSLSVEFWLTTSVICLVLGSCYLIGLKQRWQYI